MTRTDPTKIDFDFLRAFATSQHLGLELSIEQWRAPRFEVHNLVKFHLHTNEIYLCTGLQPGLFGHYLDTTKRGFHGALPMIWSKLPQTLVITGHRFGWLKIKARCVAHILKTNSK